MRAELLTIGDELLLGHVIDTNAAWLGQQVDLLGGEVTRHVTLPDEDEAIVEGVRTALERADFVVVTGGLGPTHDDRTVACVAQALGRELVFHEEVLERIRTRFGRRGRHMPESNRKQAMAPEGFEVLPNEHGTAPGLFFAQPDEHMIAILPGVPHEMQALFEEAVMPRIRARRDLRVIDHRTLQTLGVGESHLQERIGPLDDFLGRGLRLAFLPGRGGVRLRLTGLGHDADSVRETLDRFEAHVVERVGERHIISRDGASAEEAIGRFLRERGVTVALAESCTGGYLTNLFTDVPGASRYVLGAVVAYGNNVKLGPLQVTSKALEEHGAVSESVARQMAEGVRELLKADVGISTTGIAGPGGGTPEKPVGTVWVGYADAEGSMAKLLRLTDERLLNKELTAAAAIKLLHNRVREREGAPA